MAERSRAGRGFLRNRPSIYHSHESGRNAGSQALPAPHPRQLHARRREQAHPFLQALSAAAHTITDEELEILLESEWRSRLTAAWLIGFDRREHFRDVLDDLLLASRLCFSGTASP